jgi:hypothetical protein
LYAVITEKPWLDVSGLIATVQYHSIREEISVEGYIARAAGSGFRQSASLQIQV